MPGEFINADLKLELDLGKIGNIDEVLIIGKESGTVWVKGQRCNITDLVRNRENELTVYVTNTNINKASSFKEVVSVPENLAERYGKAIVPSSLPREFGFEPLLPSGLT